MQDGKPYARSFKPAGAGGASWDVEIRTSHNTGTAQTIRISAVPESPLPEGYGAYLFDTEMQRLIPLAEGTEVQVFPDKPVFAGRLLVGTAAYVSQAAPEAYVVPAETNLESGYPNPFTDEARLPYTLREDGETELTIFDVLGRRVRTLQSGASQAGYHVAVWDGRADNGGPAAPGLYVCRLVAGSKVIIRTLVLVR